MAGDTITTIIGNLTADPELRFTPSGAAVANFTVASTPRTFDKQSNEWKDGETLFMRCSVWRNAAENVAESLSKGTRVIVQGRLKMRSFEQDGQKRTVVEMEVDEVGPSLTFATAKVVRAERSGGQGQPNAAQQAAFGGQAQQQFQQGGQDPWATGPSQGRGGPQGQPGQQNPGGWGNGQQQGGQGQQQGGWGGAPPSYDEPPF